MKRILLTFLILTVSIPQFALAADEVKKTPAEAPKAAEKPEPAKEVKIGSVDLPMVGEKSNAGVKAMATLKEMYEQLQSSMKKKEQELEKMKTVLQGKSLTPEKRAAKEKQFQKKFGEYQQFGKNAQQEFARKQADLSKQIKDDLDRLIMDYGRDHGYAVILNKEGLIYNDSRYEVKDLTDEIIKLATSTGKK
ncbi:MAG TPA: OmpH family outer membrane protein [Geobacteraceae bacterium]|nr:OmpH family outer membrane protein [Geobacteraceae bacterium]